MPWRVIARPSYQGDKGSKLRTKVERALAPAGITNTPTSQWRADTADSMKAAIALAGMLKELALSSVPLDHLWIYIEEVDDSGVPVVAPEPNAQADSASGATQAEKEKAKRAKLERQVEEAKLYLEGCRAWAKAWEEAAKEDIGAAERAHKSAERRLEAAQSKADPATSSPESAHQAASNPQKARRRGTQTKET